jgi:prevent-host-death family protein
MHRVNVREARSLLGKLLTEAEHGTVVSITRRGREVARIVPPVRASSQGFPDLSEFRGSIKVKGKPTSRAVADARNEERY